MVSIECEIPKSQNLLAILLPTTTMTIKLFNRISVNDKADNRIKNIPPTWKKIQRAHVPPSAHTLKLMLSIALHTMPIVILKKIIWKFNKLILVCIIFTLSTRFGFNHHTNGKRAHTKVLYSVLEQKEEKNRMTTISFCVFEKNLIISGLICVIKQTTQRDKRQRR